MQAAQTFVNIAQLTSREASWNSGEVPPQSPIAEVLFRCRFSWSGNDQLHLESAAPTGVKRVHVNSLDVEGTVFQTF